MTPDGTDPINSEEGRRESERLAEAERLLGMMIHLDPVERWVSGFAGVALLGSALLRGGLWRVVTGVAGAGLLYQGVSGRSISSLLEGANTSNRGQGREGILVEQAITIKAPQIEVYRFVRHLPNLPRFISHLESVTPIDERRSRWVAMAPGDIKLSWESDIVDDQAGELIVWRSLVENADIENEGALRLSPASDGQGTEVRLQLKYAPPGGALGSEAARLLGMDPGEELARNLWRLKEILEA